MAKSLPDLFLDRPDCALALMFSAPARQSSPIQSVTVEFTDEEVRATVKRPRSSAVAAPRLLASKETIFAAILLYQLAESRNSEFADSLVQRAQRFAKRLVHEHEHDEFSEYSEDFLAGKTRDKSLSEFFRQLEVSSSEVTSAKQKLDDALNILERAGLVIDPACTPELMVLIGLIPVHFSVRTHLGERIYREIKINAPSWCLNVSRGKLHDQQFTDIDFRFRGVDIIRRTITSLATQYLDAEDESRRKSGRPILERDGAPELDGD
jgi:hypothetical protein